jgi:hypothetical protein
MQQNKRQGFGRIGLIVGVVAVVIAAVAAVFVLSARSTQAPSNSEVNTSTPTDDASADANELLPEDGRTLLTLTNAEELISQNSITRCDIDFNDAKPTTAATFSQQESGLSVELPYNPDWGNEQFKIQPYERFELSPGPNQTINFGPMFVGEGCGWFRAYTLQIGQQRSAQVLINGLTESSQTSTPMVVGEPQQVKIGDLTAVKYEEVGLCNGQTIEVIGQSHNYILRPLCGGDSKEEFEFLESIVKTIRLI